MQLVRNPPVVPPKLNAKVEGRWKSPLPGQPSMTCMQWLPREEGKSDTSAVCSLMHQCIIEAKAPIKTNNNCKKCI